MMAEHSTVRFDAPSDSDLPLRSSGLRQPRIVAITGGKGGVGKTSVAVNLALSFARRGQKVLLLDGDTDLANVSILLGQYPSKTLEQVLDGQCTFDDVIMKADFGLHVIPGASGVERCMDLGRDEVFPVLRDLATLEKRYDLILIDTASGLQPTALHMVATAMLACVIITPDPASLTDAFSLLRVLQRRGYKRTPGVIVNMARGASQAREVYRRFSGAVRRHLAMDVDYLGAVWRDETLRHSVEVQRPVATLAETDPSCRQFLTLAEMLEVHLARMPPRKSGFAAYWHHRTRQASDAAQAEREAGAASADQPEEPSTANVSGEAGPASDRFASPVVRCRQLFDLVDQLLAANPAEPALRSEALRQAAALIAGIADSLPEAAEPASGSLPPPSSGSPEPDGPAYDESRFGKQQALLGVLREQSPEVSVDQFLSGLPSGYDH